MIRRVNLAAVGIFIYTFRSPLFAWPWHLDRRFVGPTVSKMRDYLSGRRAFQVPVIVNMVEFLAYRFDVCLRFRVKVKFVGFAFALGAYRFSNATVL